MTEPHLIRNGTPHLVRNQLNSKRRILSVRFNNDDDIPTNIIFLNKIIND